MTCYQAAFERATTMRLSVGGISPSTSLPTAEGKEAVDEIKKKKNLLTIECEARGDRADSEWWVQSFQLGNRGASARIAALYPTIRFFKL